MRWGLKFDVDTLLQYSPVLEHVCHQLLNANDNNLGSMLAQLLQKASSMLQDDLHVLERYSVTVTQA